MQIGHEREDNSEVNLHETGYKDGSLMGLAKDNVQWQTSGCSARICSVYYEKPANF